MITEPEGQVSKRRFVFSDSVGAIAAWLAPRVEDRNFTIRASPVSAIPKVLFEDDHSLYLNGSAISSEAPCLYERGRPRGLQKL